MKGYRGFFRPTDLLTRSELSLLIERLSVDTSDIRMPQGIHVERSELIELLYLMAQKYQATQITSGELEGVWNLESTTLSGADISKVRSRTVTFE